MGSQRERYAKKADDMRQSSRVLTHQGDNNVLGVLLNHDSWVIQCYDERRQDPRAEPR